MSKKDRYPLPDYIGFHRLDERFRKLKIPEYLLKGNKDDSISLLRDYQPVSTLDLDGYVTYRNLYPNNSAISWGYKHLGGYTFQAFANIYTIGGEVYTDYIQSTITLPSGEAQDRTDLLVINENRTLGFVKGTSGSLTPNPIDQKTQTILAPVLVEANTTSPSYITNNLVYNENTQEPSEFNTSKSGSTIFLECYEQSSSDSMSIKFSSSPTGSYVSFETSTPINPNEIPDIQFNFFGKTTDRDSKLRISVLSGGEYISSTFITNGQYGYRPTVLNQWQSIYIPKEVLRADSTGFDEIRIETVSAERNITFYIDEVNLQRGLQTYYNSGEDGSDVFRDELGVNPATSYSENISHGGLIFSGASELDIDNASNEVLPNKGWILANLGGGGGVTDHTLLTNIGVNTHDDIDSHISDTTIHFTQGDISITESQISDLGSYLEDAPIDGNDYARRNGAWTQVEISPDFQDVLDNGDIADRSAKIVTDDGGQGFYANNLAESRGFYGQSLGKVGVYSNNKTSELDANTRTLSFFDNVGNRVNLIGNLATGVKNLYLPNLSGTLLTDAPADGNDYVRNNNVWVQPTLSGGGATELEDLIDVSDSNPTTSYVLVGQGSTFISRQLSIFDIIGMDTYVETELNDLTTAVVWADVPDANITESSVTQHESALTITESQISDLSHFSPTDLLTDYGFTDNSSDWDTAFGWGDHSTEGYLLDAPANGDTFARRNNSWVTLSASGVTELGDLVDVTSSTPTNRNVLVADGANWVSRPLIEADIINLQSYLTSEANDLTSSVVWADVPDVNITESSVTQHQSALSITESQISDFGTYDNYNHFNLLTNGVERTSIFSDANLDLVAGTNMSISYSAGGVVTFDVTGGGSTDYVSNVVLNGTDLEFTGVGSAFSSTIDLSSLGGGSSVPIQDDGVQIVASPSALNFTGAGVTVSDVGGIATVDIPSVGGSSYTDEEAQDAVAAAIAAGTSTRISIVYNDASNLFDFTVDDDLSNYDNSTTLFLQEGTAVAAINSALGQTSWQGATLQEVTDQGSTTTNNVEVTGNLSVGDGSTSSNTFNSKFSVDVDIENGTKLVTATNVTKNSANVGDIVYANQTRGEYKGSTDFATLRGMSVFAEHEGTGGNIGQLSGLYSEAKLEADASASVTNMYGLTGYSWLDANNDADATFATGGRFNVHTESGNTGTINDAYGNYVEIQHYGGHINYATVLMLDVDQGGTSTIDDLEYIRIGNGVTTATPITKVINSLVDAPSIFAGTMESKSFIKTGATADDVLLGDGTTTSLAGIGGGGGSGDSLIYNDSLTSQIDGVTQVFTTTSNFVSGKTILSYNGQVQVLDVDYTETGANEITFSSITPDSPDELTITYAISSGSVSGVDSVVGETGVVSAAQLVSAFNTELGQTDWQSGGTSGSDIVKTDNYTTLSAIASPTDGDVVYVKGRDSDNDGGQGVFIYDSIFSATDDGGITIDGWVRQIETKEIFSEWFGDDYLAVNAALDIAGSIPVRITKSMSITGEILVDSNQTLYINDNVVLSPTDALGSTNAVIRNKNASDTNIHIEGGTIDGSAATGIALAAVELDTVIDSVIKNVDALNISITASIEDGNFRINDCTRVNIVDCTTDGTWRIGVNIIGGSDNKIIGGKYLNGRDSGIAVSSSPYSKLLGVYVDNCGTSDASNISFNSQYGLIDGITSINASGTNNGNGITLGHDPEEASYTVVVNSLFKDNAAKGVLIQGVDTEQVLISNNKIFENGVGSAGTNSAGVAVLGGCTDNKITNNIIQGNKNGVSLNNTSLRTEIIGNEIRNNVINGIRNDGVSTRIINNDLSNVNNVLNDTNSTFPTMFGNDETGELNFTIKKKSTPLANTFTQAHMRLGATDQDNNSTASIAYKTSTTDLYGMTTGVERLTGGTDFRFVLKSHKNSDVGTDLMEVDDDGATTFSSTVEASGLSITGGTSDDVLLGDGTTTSLAGIGGGGSVTIDYIEVTQNAHGFVVGEAIEHNGTNYSKALADDVDTADTLGVVSEVVDVNTFKLQYTGILAGAWTDGEHYFLSTTVAGAVVVEPTYNVGEVRQYIGTGTPDGLLINIDIGQQITSDGGIGGGSGLSLVWNETLTGTVDGSNKVFTTANGINGNNINIAIMSSDGDCIPLFLGVGYTKTDTDEITISASINAPIAGQSVVALQYEQQ